MSTAANPYCRRIFRTPTFLKSLEEWKVGPKEADDITHFVASNAQSGTIEHRQMGFVLKRLPWKPQLWVQFLEDDASNVYLLTMTDEEASPRPPTKKARLARVLDRLWVAAAVKGAEWLAHLLRGLTQTTRQPSAHRLKSASSLALVGGAFSGDAGTAGATAGHSRLDAADSSEAFIRQYLSSGEVIEGLSKLSSNVRPLGSSCPDLQARVSRADVKLAGEATPTWNQAGRDTNTLSGAHQLGSSQIASKDDSNH